MIRGASVRVNQDNLTRVHTVHGHQLAHKNLVRTVWVEDFEAKGQRVPHFGRGLHIGSGTVGNLHCYVGRVDNHFLGHCRLDISCHSKVNFVTNGLVGQIILASDSKTKVRTCDDGVVMLNDDIVHVTPQTLMLHSTLNIIKSHFEFKVQTSLDVLNARVGASLGVDLAVEQFVSFDSCHHVSGAAVNADVVTGGQFVRLSLGHVQIGFLNSN
uniref:Uncharacterized protein n=1 Tax=Cacopsylla melanoneura TaxID=428564 RepID=A0A8D8ZE61_9HEMI